MDDAQFDYLLALMGGRPHVLEAARKQQQQQHKKQPAGGAGAGGPGGSGGAAGPSGSGGGGGAGPSRPKEDPAVAARRASLVSQVGNCKGAVTALRGSSLL